MIVVFADPGVVAGGWEFLVAAYTVTWLFLGGYTASLWIRSREER